MRRRKPASRNWSNQPDLSADERRELQELEAKLLNGSSGTQSPTGGGGGGAAERTGASAPTAAAPASRGVQSGAVTYVNNINIAGIGQGTTRHVDEESARTEMEILRRLAQAKRSAIYPR